MKYAKVHKNFLTTQYSALSLGVWISAIWLANTECIYAISSAISKSWIKFDIALGRTLQRPKSWRQNVLEVLFDVKLPQNNLTTSKMYWISDEIFVSQTIHSAFKPNPQISTLDCKTDAFFRSYYTQSTSIDLRVSKYSIFDSKDVSRC